MFLAKRTLIQSHPISSSADSYDINFLPSKSSDVECYVSTIYARLGGALPCRGESSNSKDAIPVTRKRLQFVK